MDRRSRARARGAHRSRSKPPGRTKRERWPLHNLRELAGEAGGSAEAVGRGVQEFEETRARRICGRWRILLRAQHRDSALGLEEFQRDIPAKSVPDSGTIALEKSF